ncbi:Uncharacterised protein [Mycobacteroides abscessus subsp. abscessus]|nr:Uncharacterised protein [Mycobacteroides abscessus subsp. abscessus]
MPDIAILASASDVLAFAPCAAARIALTWSMALVSYGFSLDSTRYRAECPSGDMKTRARSLNLSLPRISGEM